MQSPEALARLDALAAKLNVTATHLWEVLTRQAYAEAAGTGLFVAFVVACAIAYRILWRRCAPEKDYSWDEGSLFAVGFGGVALLVMATIAVIGMASSIGYIVNPEYFALSQVLGAIGGR